MISLQDAQKTSFSTSTRAELRAYAEQLGLENIPANANAAQLKKAVCSALGIATEPDGRPAPQVKVETTAGGDKIFPSYNLTPNGIWQGRRHRLSIPRPEGMKLGQAEGFQWNGKHVYYIPFDEVDAVPEPIYNIIVTNKRPRVKSTKPIGGEMGEATTSWEFDSAPMTYHGVDEATKDRAGSLLEWYQSRGSEWFADKTDRQITQIAQKLEVPTTAWAGDKMPPRMLSTDELRGRIMEFLYGYADAKVEPNESILA